jgi:hypothetical protein
VSVTRGVTLLTALLTIQLFGPTRLDPIIVSLYVEGCALAVLWSYYGGARFSYRRANDFSQDLGLLKVRFTIPSRGYWVKFGSV